MSRSFIVVFLLVFNIYQIDAQSNVDKLTPAFAGTDIIDSDPIAVKLISDNFVIPFVEKKTVVVMQPSILEVNIVKEVLPISNEQFIEISNKKRNVMAVETLPTIDIPAIEVIPINTY